MNDAQKQLSELLQYGVESLDVPEHLDGEMTEAYTRLGAWIRQDNEQIYHTDSEIYPQGSRRLGTLVRPVKDSDDYDIDLVYRRDLKRERVTQEALKGQAGDQLRRYAMSLGGTGVQAPTIEEGRRCWTLRYGSRFHLDVLPALPDEVSAGVGGPRKDAIIITDRELRHWQHSNPKGYATWFRGRMAAAIYARRDAMAKSAKVDIEQIPEENVTKTPLQRAVQLLKRHRDLFYQGHPDDRPISIVITTLAARAYNNQTDLYEAFTALAKGMQQFVQNRNGVLWVPNPINEQENFADKWQHHPERAQAFFSWLAQLNLDIDSAANVRGLDEVSRALERGWGNRFAQEAATKYASSVRAQRTSGLLRATSVTATLGAVGATKVPAHTFFGGKGD